MLVKLFLDHYSIIFEIIEATPLYNKSEKVNDFNKIKLKLRGMLNLKYFEGITTTVLGCKLSSPIGIGPLPPLYDIGLVHRVKDLSENKNVI